MTAIVLWCGFVGAWLLVAGPLQQAAMELHAEEIQREDVEAAAAGVPRPRPASPWWWLLPPVKYLMERRRSQAYRRQVFATLDARTRAGIADYMNKATGWLFVAGGAFLIAAKETWELLEHYELSVWLWAVVLAVLAIAATGNAAVRVSRADDMKATAPHRSRSVPGVSRTD